MAIPMQGSWTVSVKSKSGASQQRFVIYGAASGNGTYAGDVTTPVVSVTGGNWLLQIQHNSGGWFRDSADLINVPVISGGQYRFDIQGSGTGNDRDCNDLILTCSTPFTPTDFIVFGNVTSYGGDCYFPCWRGWYFIDSPASLGRALRYPAMRKAIEIVYPDWVRIKPIPLPDPSPFVPMLISMDDESLIPTKRVQPIPMPQGEPKPAQSTPVPPLPSLSSSMGRTAVVTKVAERSGFVIDRIGIGSVLDRCSRLCSSDTLAGFPITFEECDRTSAELASSAFSSTGARQNLGKTVTDRHGNYILRYSRSITQFIEESDIDVGVAEDEVVQSMPALTETVLFGITPGNVAAQSPPYWNIPVIKRIDLCFPKGA